MIDLGEEFKFQGDIPAATAFPDIGTFVSSLLPNVYVVAGLSLFVFILLGGFTMITNAGNQEKLQQGQKILTSAILGFAILFGSYWVIQIIQVLTGIPILNPGI